MAERRSILLTSSDPRQYVDKSFIGSSHIGLYVTTRNSDLRDSNQLDYGLYIGFGEDYVGPSTLITREDAMELRDFLNSLDYGDDDPPEYVKRRTQEMQISDAFDRITTLEREVNGIKKWLIGPKVRK